MDLLAQHEAFLRAIFDAPDDDTPRLVYADFLQENGEEDGAELIRARCERLQLGAESCAGRRMALDEKCDAMWNRLVPSEFTSIPTYLPPTNRGLWCSSPGIEIATTDLANPRAFRERVVRTQPAWYGATYLRVIPGSCLVASHIQNLCQLPFVTRVSFWNFAGRAEVDNVPESLVRSTPPAVTTKAVDALVMHPAAIRITILDLSNNELDNDAALALVSSPYLSNLKHLSLLEGNRLRGKVWQRVIERFGEDVVE